MNRLTALNKPSRVSRVGLALAVPVLAAGRAHASNIEFCVSNNSQFAAALASAEAVPTTIKLVQGTYDFSGTAWDNGQSFAVSAANTKVLGGYTSGCATRHIARGNTILEDTNTSGRPFVIVHGDLTLEGLTWHTSPYIDANNIGDEDFGPPPGTIDLPPGTELLVRRNAFINADILFDWGQDDDVGGTIRVVDSLFVENADCAAAFDVIAGGTPDVDIINNTVIGELCASDHYQDGWGYGLPNLYAYNNILHSSGAYDVYTNSGAWYLVDNMINHYHGPAPISEVGTLTGNPQLDSSYRPIETPPSPVINTGSNEAPGGLPNSDLDGGPRIVGTAVDRGAYESSVDDELLLSVTNASDSGAGSLRAAIQSANINGAGLITFNIGSGCGPHVITLASELPALTSGALINGYSQTGASDNDLDVGDDAKICVILEAGNSGVTRALRVPTSAADNVSASIRGIGFSGFSDAAIDLEGGQNHFVAGNHFGGNIGGHTMQPNGIDIRVGGNAHDATIGGDDDANRNIIGDATQSGIVLLSGTHNDQIVNNYIGVGWNISGGNYTDRGNASRGIRILGGGNTVSGNLIGDNVQAGILVDGGSAISNTIDGNFIGEDADGVVLGNGDAGIHFTDENGFAASYNTIRYNAIANNGGAGVWADSGVQNKIRKNAIHDNGGLGIDLGTQGVLPNDDDGQNFEYANRGQNYPVLTRAAGAPDRGRISGTLTTVPGDYVIDVYASPSCDASGYGEGALWFKGATVTVPATQSGDQGTATFGIVVTRSTPPLLVAGEAISVTATDADGNTSELSACMSYIDDVIFADGFD